MSKIPVAVQIFSVRHEYQADLRGTLAKVASMGYEGVDFFGNPPLPASELRAVLNDLGLKVAGWHVGYQKLEAGSIEETIAYHHELGNKFLIVPGLPKDRVTSHADMLGWASWLDGIASKLAPHHMLTGYHSHGGDHVEIEGHTLWDVLFTTTGNNVVMQIDIGNSASAGVDTLAEIRKHPGRARSVHLKPYSPSLKATGGDPYAPVIGEDELPWPDLLEACETVGGTEWYVVEYECPALPALEGVERCLHGLRALGR
ncbi:MAG: sugar phosphate isomerase/epimerase [Chloroflexi bacterium]|jgi:sugar phosphate isomerase/epimerase|nr:sugar phosphate isomerase/epimerase [Chloroflexota bacterium]